MKIKKFILMVNSCLGDFVLSHFVLSVFSLYLTSHFDRSSSTRDYGQESSNDRSNCFASYSVNPGSFMQYAG